MTPVKCTMSQHDAHPTATLVPTLTDRPARTRTSDASVEAAAYACLVVSSDPLRQLMFGRTAERTGWRPLVCADAAAALKHLASVVVGAALVDIATPAEQGAMTMRMLVERLAANKGVLTVVCGRTNDRVAAIWARELGVWAHLPGVAPESDLDSLLRAARQVVQRMQQLRGATGVGEM